MASTVKLDANLVQEVRKALFERIREDDYDEKDMDRYKTQDTQVARHIKPNSKKKGKELVDETVDNMIKMLEWRSEYDVANSFDYEFDPKTIKAWEPFVSFGGKDKKGAKIIWSHIHNWSDDLYDKVPEGKRYGAHLMEKFDVENWNDKGFAYWADHSKAGASNIKVESTKYFCSVVPFFRGGLQYLAMYEMPILARSAWPMMASLVPDMVDFSVMVNKADLDKYIDPSELPAGVSH